MAQTNYVSIGLAGVNFYAIDSSQKFDLGSRCKGKSATYGVAEFIYLKGVASTAEGSWVIYDEEFVTTLLPTDPKGNVAVAMAATVADTYGWYCIFGKCAASTTSVDDNDLLYQEAAGQCSDTVTAGDRVFGAIARSATDTPATGLSWVELSYPICTDSDA